MKTAKEMFPRVHNMLQFAQIDDESMPLAGELRSLLDHWEKTQWMPITTHPGTPTIVLLRAHGDVSSGELIKNPSYSFWVRDDDNRAEIFPTHWMPLPEAPR